MGDYPPESRLPTETKLAQDYGVSRTIVRSALEHLKNDGVVQSRQGSGTVVVPFDPGAIAKLNRDAQMPRLKDCYACRLAIEPAIASTVAQSLSDDASSSLEEQRFMLIHNEENDESQRSADDAQFHIQLAHFSRNSFFVSAMNNMRPHMLFAMNVAKTLTLHAQQRHFDLSQKEHLKIIEAILMRNPDIAFEAMRAHIHKGSERIFQNQETASCG